MATINGIGTRFNGFSSVDSDGKCTATNWFTLFYIPVLPLWRAEIKREMHLPLKEFKYEVIRKTSLEKDEIVMTYFYGWILIPISLLLPFFFLIPEVTDMLGIQQPAPRNLIKGDPLNWYDWLFIFCLVYLAFICFNLYRWDIKKGLPEDYKRKLDMI